MVKTIDVGDSDPDRRIRREWGEALAEHLDLHELTRKQFRAALLEHGIDVSEQAISMWIVGRSAPRPHVMIAIAKVLKVPARSLFPLTEAA